MHYVPAQRLIDAQYVPHLAKKPLLGAVNVRMFRIADGRAGETLMDTQGLAAIGLRDFQHRFVDLDPAVIANLLRYLAGYVFERGPVIEDGDALTGIYPGQTWTCRFEESISAPGRKVIDIEPSAAGA